MDQLNEAENKKKFLVQTERLKILLRVPQKQRTEEVCQEIADIAGQIKFLSNYKQKPDFLQLCKNLYLKTFDKQQRIFKQGDNGDAFYVILDGSVKVYIDEPTSYKNFMHLKETAQLSKGDAFGEISLLYNSKRTATVIANERSDLIVLEKDAFQEYIRTMDAPGGTEMKTVHLNKLLVFLESVPIFQECNKGIMVQLCTKCVIQCYPSQTLLVRQGSECPQLYIVKNGIVKVIKHFKMEASPKLTNPAQDCYYEIDELGDGDLFGDWELFTEQPAGCTYMTAINSDIVSISGFHLKKILPPDILEKYQKHCKAYPDDQDIKEMYQEKLRWDQFKRKLIKDIKAQKQVNKGFDATLRLPYLPIKTLKAPINFVNIKSSDRVYHKIIEKSITPRPFNKQRTFLDASQ